jgi:ankyrin repeat protein
MKLKEKIFHVVQKNDKEGLLALIPQFHQQKISLDQRNDLGQTPLSLAIAKGFLEVGELLLKEGSNPNSKDLLDVTPLQYLLNYEGNKLKGFDKMFLNLLEAGANLNEESLSKGSVVSQLIKTGRNNMFIEVLKLNNVKPSLEEIHEGFLLICRAKPLLKLENRYHDRSTWNALNNEQVNVGLSRLKSYFIALQKQKFPEGDFNEFTKELMNQKDSHGRTLAMNSIIYGNLYALDYLIQNNGDMSIHDHDKLRAIDHLCMSKSIKEEQITKPIYNNLVHWIRQEHAKTKEITSSIQSSREKFNARLQGSIERAILGNKFELANWLYQDGVKPTKEGKEFLSKVLTKLLVKEAENTNDEFSLNAKVKSLLEFGADPNYSYRGKLALNEAIKSQRFDLAILLLDAGANFKGIDQDGLDGVMQIAKTPYNPKEGEYTLYDMNENHQDFMRVLSRMEEKGLNPSSKIESTKSGIPLTDLYMKMAMENKNIPFMCRFLEKGYTSESNVERIKLKNLMLSKEGAFLSSVYLNKSFEILQDKNSLTIDEEKEKRKSEVSGSDLYNMALIESKFELANRIKKNLESKGQKLNLNQPDFLGRTAFLNAILSGKSELALRAILTDKLEVDFTKKDIFGDNCLHYLSSKFYKKNSYFVHQEKNEIYYEDPIVEEHKRSNLFQSVIYIIQNMDPKNIEAKNMLQPKLLREYFQISVDSGNLDAAKTLIKLGVLEPMKEVLFKLDLKDKKDMGEDSSPKGIEDAYYVAKLESQAAKEGNISLLDIIYKSGVSVDLKGKELSVMDETPLFQAIKHSQFKTAIWLLEHEANPNSKDALGRTPLMALCSHKDLEKSLKEYPSPKEEFHEFYYELITKLLEGTQGLEEEGGGYARSYIKASLEAGNINFARTLIGIGNAINKIDPNKGEMSLKMDDLPYIFKKTPPFPKSSILAKDILKIELQFLDAYLTTKNKEEIAIRPLLNASAMSNLKEVSQLLSRGVDIEGRDRSGKTAIFYGAEFGNVDTLKLLLENNAKLYQQDYKGNTPLDGAIEKGKIQNAVFLISRAPELKPKKENVYRLSQLLEVSHEKLSVNERKILEEWLYRKIGRRFVEVFPKTQNTIVPLNHVSKRSPKLNTYLNSSTKAKGLGNKKIDQRKFIHGRGTKRFPTNKKINMSKIRSVNTLNQSLTI